MSPVPVFHRSDRLAFGLGVGLVFSALVGIPLRFAFLEIPPLLVYGGAFLLGLLTGFILAPRYLRNRRG